MLKTAVAVTFNIAADVYLVYTKSIWSGLNVSACLNAAKPFCVLNNITITCLLYKKRNIYSNLIFALGTM